MNDDRIVPECTVGRLGRRVQVVRAAHRTWSKTRRDGLRTICTRTIC